VFLIRHCFIQLDTDTRGVFQFGTLHCPMLCLQTTETQLFLMQWDIKVEVATVYKKESFVHNSKQE